MDYCEWVLRTALALLRMPGLAKIHISWTAQGPKQRQYRGLEQIEPLLRFPTFIDVPGDAEDVRVVLWGWDEVAEEDLAQQAHLLLETAFLRPSPGRVSVSIVDQDCGIRLYRLEVTMPTPHPAPHMPRHFIGSQPAPTAR